MTVTLDQVVPWGRTMDEYRSFFALTDGDLDGHILGCGDGPASFNAEMTAAGRSVVSIDPLYAFSTHEIAERIDATYPTIIGQVAAQPDDFVWSRFRDPGHLGEHRRSAMEHVLSDYDTGRRAGRYRLGALPALGFGDDEFDLALCSHLLFLYSEQMSASFHIAAARELLRVARELRIFPLLALDGLPSAHLTAVTTALGDDGCRVEFVPVPYEFQKGGNQMMRIRR